MNQIENNTLIHIGNILNTKGIKGEIVFNVLIKNIFIPTDSKIKIGYSKQFCKEYTIRQDINTNSIYSSLLLKEIDNKEKAIELKEQGLFIERNTILKYNPSIVLPDEIIGSKIINNDTDEFIGIVKEYWHLPANDVLLVDTNDGEIPIPYIDDVIKDINIKNRIIKIFLLDGLMELKTKKK